MHIYTRAAARAASFPFTQFGSIDERILIIGLTLPLLTVGDASHDAGHVTNSANWG
ncbi:hypothetical protein BCL74_0080 [Oceanibaculum indicum]|uniref:Uncharacterized protein n=1 Tax=Oceanibaculum indicum TaxID=526216 RepID=A0A420WMT1_9PROT|nr:hypothetical protein BCL74_0080 [Oceanibaculum indicum]